jgi:two-component system sensor histidine kinase/response regulator
MPEQPEPPQPTRVLVVEDDDVQQSILRWALAGQGYEVEVAPNGLDAVRKAREGRYDLVLVDYHLPEIDGIGTARLIHDVMGETARPVLVAVTAWPDQLAYRQKVSGGAFDGIIAKPVRFPELFSAIEGYLQSAPNRTTRRGGQQALLARNWAEYDAGPDRPLARDGTPTPPYILLVEDDAPQQLMLRTALESNGYMVETASDGMQAVRMIRRGAYDLALIDYLLPEIDGLAAARLILDLMSEGVRPRMVALTGVPAELSVRQAGPGSAFDEVIPKTSGLTAVLAAVDRRLRSAPNSATRRAAEVAHPHPAGGEAPTP